VDKIEELEDGVALCDIAKMVCPDRQVGCIRDVYLEEEAQVNLSTAVRVAGTFDKGLAKMCSGARDMSQLGRYLFGGNKHKLIVRLLQSYRMEHERQKTKRQQQDGRKISEPQVKKIVKSVVCREKHVVRKKPEDLTSRPGWNNSVFTKTTAELKFKSEKTASAKAPVRRLQLKKKKKQSVTKEKPAVAQVGDEEPVFQNGSLYDPRYRVGKKPTQSHSSGKDSTRVPAKKVVKLQVDEQKDVLSVLHLVMDNPTYKESLSYENRETLEWLLQPCLLPSILQRFQRCTLCRKALSVMVPTDGHGMDVVSLLSSIFCDGVLLCELVRTLEYLVGDCESKSSHHPCVEQLHRETNGQVLKHLVLKGMNLIPKTHGAKMKNLSLSLSILRNRPKLNPRHLFSLEAIVHMEPAAVTWELIYDIRCAYGNEFFQRQSEANATNMRPRMRSSSFDEKQIFRKSSNSRGKQRSVSLTSSQGSAGTGARKRRSNSIQSYNDQLLAPSKDTAKHSSKLSKSTSTIHGLLGPHWQREFCQVGPEEIPLVELNEAQEAELQKWLVRVGVHSFGEMNTPRPLLDDPIRNGLFFVELFSVLDRDVRYILENKCEVYKSPKSVAQATHNVLCAFHALFHVLMTKIRNGRMDSNTHTQRLSTILRKDVKVFLKGDRSHLWNLIYTMHQVFDNLAEPEESSGGGDGTRPKFPEGQSYLFFNGDPEPIEETKTQMLDRMYQARGKPDLVPKKTPRPISSTVPRLIPTKHTPSDTYDMLPYTEGELVELERSLGVWIGSLAILDQQLVQDIVGNNERILSNSTIRRSCENGTLLADIAMAIAPDSEKPIVGIFRNPKTLGIARKNVEKVLHALRLRENMGMRFLFSGEAICNGERGIILGLLEDLHRAHKKVLPRPVKVLDDEKPFLGTVSQPQRQRRKSRGKDDLSHGNLSIRCNISADIWPSPVAVEDVSLYTRSRNSTLASGGGSASSILAPRSTNISTSSVTTAKKRNHDIIPLGNTRPFERHDLGHRAGDIQDADVEPENLNLDVDEIDELIDWIVRINRIPLRDPEDLHDLQGFAPEFNDGAILCALLEKLEHVKGGIRGVQQRPKTTAACLHNIRTVLQLLQQNKKMPTKYLWSEKDIASGRVKVIVPLLLQIKRAYTF